MYKYFFLFILRRREHDGRRVQAAVATGAPEIDRSPKRNYYYLYITMPKGVFFFFCEPS